MALRALGRALAPALTRASSSTPTVFDRMVQIFVIDKSGVRHTVRGLEGASLASALQEYGGFGDDSFMPHVFEPGLPDCHVYVQGDYLDKLPPLDGEAAQDHARVLETAVRAKARDNSRMAHYIALTPALNGMTVALGDVEPWETQ
ncbi:Fdx1 [Scenedesmus sp. PABB004]|nr:Fdx1 [Scenedesmus sp. PABB004]